jgi:hypothetical protein
MRLFPRFSLVGIAIALCALAAGCGGTSKTSAPATTTSSGVDARRHCDGLSEAKQARQRRTLQHDLVALRAAAKTMKAYAQDGNPQLNRALDRFSLDVAQEALPVYDRSRFIDRAAAIVAPRCYLCFQTLENNRPVGATSKLPCD